MSAGNSDQKVYVYVVFSSLFCCPPPPKKKKKARNSLAFLSCPFLFSNDVERLAGPKSFVSLSSGLALLPLSTLAARKGGFRAYPQNTDSNI